MTANTRVSFLIRQATALGTTVSNEENGGVMVAIDPNYMQGSQGVLRVVAWFAVVSLTVVPS